MKTRLVSKLAGGLGPLLTLVLIVALAVPALAVPVLADGLPPIPHDHQFWGSVEIGETPAEPGTVVTAKIDGVADEWTSTVVDIEGYDAYYGLNAPPDYSDNLLLVPANNPDTTEKDGGVEGDTVKFYVLDKLAGQALFVPDGTTELPLTIADISALNAAITEADLLVAADYTDASWAVLDAARDAGVIVQADADATQLEVDNATLAIDAAIDDLVFAGQADLDEAVAEAALLDAADYTVDSWAVLDAALDLDDSTNALVLAKTAAIDAAIDALVAEAGDLTAYNAALAAVNETDYTEASWTTYQLVVAANVVTTDNTQAEVDTATGNITAAQGALVFDGQADLDAAIIAAGELTAADYTAGSWAVLVTALALPETTNAEVVAKTTDINDAIIALEFVTPPAVTIDPVTSPTNNATPTLTGDRHEGATVVLTSDEATFGAVDYITTTTWSCEVTLVEGSNVITATADTSTATATIDLDTTAPTVVSKSPAADAPGVAVGTTVSVTFSEAMDASTITISSFTLDSVSGSVSYSSGTYTFTPSDNLTLDATYTATLSTAITDAVGNPLAEYSWSFTTAKASLGDLIDDILAVGEDTLELPAGTYAGNITIDEPITITGIEGETIISGGIHIAPLTGSDVTIEYLTITDYTAYGIWIELVGADDVFTIRNNTIDGAGGNVIGIQVDEVEAGGILDIWQNSISGNETGIKLEDVAAGAIEFNNITGNEVGLELQRVQHMVNASMNWWGDISGPEEGNWNPGGTGDKIELPDGLSYYPWLTREFQTVLADNIAYFGFPMVQLNTGWNIMSTPIALDPLVEWVDSEGTSRTGVNTWGDYIALGDGLDIHDISPAWRFDSQTQAWLMLTTDDTLEPCEAIYVRMASDDIAPILFSPTYSVPSKDLYSGWNLISLAWLDPEVWSMPANEALVTVKQVTGDLTGYKLVVSPSVSPYESPWIYIAGDPSPAYPDGWMTITSGYWVFMLNEGTLAGFTFTPISLR